MSFKSKITAGIIAGAIALGGGVATASSASAIVGNATNEIKVRSSSATSLSVLRQGHWFSVPRGGLLTSPFTVATGVIVPQGCRVFVYPYYKGTQASPQTVLSSGIKLNVFKANYRYELQSVC